jgi:hypothetical protein
VKKCEFGSSVYYQSKKIGNCLEDGTLDQETVQSIVIKLVNGPIEKIKAKFK